jgi:AraC family transcriptional regulator, transcriptional activator of pobA
MDDRRIRWYYPNMAQPGSIPAFGLYGEGRSFPDMLHCERISDRARLHDWQIAPHRHPNLHQAMLIRRGNARITVDGRARDLALPVLLNIPPWVVHGFRFAAGTEGYVLTLPADGFAEVLGDGAPLAPALSRLGGLRRRARARCAVRGAAGRAGAHRSPPAPDDARARHAGPVPCRARPRHAGRGQRARPLRRHMQAFDAAPAPASARRLAARRTTPPRWGSRPRISTA